MPVRQAPRPVRHRAGKRTGNESDSDSDSGSGSGSGSDSGSDSRSEPGDNSRANVTARSRPAAPTGPAFKPAASSFPTRPPRPTRDDSDDSDDSDSDDSGSDSDSSSGSESDRPQLVRPVFMSKAKRALLASQRQNPTTTITTGATTTPNQKQAQADAVLQTLLEKEALEAAVRKSGWDDEVAVAQAEADIDDTDDADPETEYAEWKLRELLRLKRDRDRLIAGEKEREEVERRRNLDADERAREDAEFIDRQERERMAKVDAAAAARAAGHAPSQRHFHKGAFFAAENAETRDFSNARYEDGIGDRDIVPEYLRVRDGTMVGRKSRTRYRTLQTEDTGEWGRYDSGRDRDGRPDRQADRTGSNTVEIGDRKRVRRE